MLVVSYADFYSDDSFDFQPTFVIQKICVDCALVEIPRPVPVTARRFRGPPLVYSVSHHGAKTQRQGDGLKEMQPGEIYIDRDWLGPTLVDSNCGSGTPRNIYTNNIYIPIPISLFAATDTRLFDIDVKVWVSIANNSPTEVRVSKRLSFTQFLRMNADGSIGCSLMS